MQISEFGEFALNEAFKELTPAQKRVWNLCMRDRMSIYKAAKLLNISDRAVQQRLICAKKENNYALRADKGAIWKLSGAISATKKSSFENFTALKIIRTRSALSVLTVPRSQSFNA